MKKRPKRERDKKNVYKLIDVWWYTMESAYKYKGEKLVDFEFQLI